MSLAERQREIGRCYREALAAESSQARERELVAVMELVRAGAGAFPTVPWLVEVLVAMSRLVLKDDPDSRAVDDAFGLAVALAAEVSDGGSLETNTRALFGHLLLRRGCTDLALVQFERARDVAIAFAHGTRALRRSTVCSVLRALGRHEEQAAEAMAMISDAPAVPGDPAAVIIAGYMHLADALERAQHLQEAYAAYSHLEELLSRRSKPQAARERERVRASMRSIRSRLGGAV